MRRKILTISALSIGHFLICIVLTFLVFISVIGSYLDAPSDLSGRIAAWSLIILLFPVRNLTNLFVSHPDHWLRDATGILIIAGASALWGIAIYYSVSWLRSIRKAA
jgi:presenilin-like A22 family membrane protease